MFKLIIRIVAAILNIGIVALILSLVFYESLEFDNLNSWVFIAVAMITPLINISGLFGKPEFIKPLTVLIANTLVLAFFTPIILLVIIWPMGSKPRGSELIYVLSFYSALLFTESANILKMVKSNNF